MWVLRNTLLQSYDFILSHTQDLTLDVQFLWSAEFDSSFFSSNPFFQSIQLVINASAINTQSAHDLTRPW